MQYASPVTRSADLIGAIPGLSARTAESWNRIRSLPPSRKALAMTELLIATEDGLHRVDDGSAETELAGHAVDAVAVDGDTWWALVDGHVWRRTAGLVWEQVDAVHPMRATALLPTTAGLLVGTAGAHLALLHGDLRTLDAFEHVQGRERWHTPWGAPPDVRSMTVDTAGTWYVNVHVGGVVRSADQGASWQPTIDIDTDVHQIVTGFEDRLLYAATGAAGLATSADGGDTWATHRDGLHATYARAVTVTPGAVLVSASTGPRGERATVYRWRGGVFERCTDGLPEWFGGNIDTGCLHAHGEVVAFGTADGAVYVSEDAGVSWSAALEGLPPVRHVLVR